MGKSSSAAPESDATPPGDQPRLPSASSDGDMRVGPTSDAVCPQCKGAGWYTESVRFGHPHFGVVFPCVCKRREQAHRAREELLHLSNLAAFQQKTFATFDQFVPGLSNAYLRALAYARQPQGWLVFFGSYGVGKTHLAAAIANTVLQRGEGVLFVIVPDLLDHLRAGFAPEQQHSYDERFDRIRKAPLLVLDDLGTEQTTPWAREKVYQLINHRYNEQLATVFTSNLAPEAIDPRILSRMYDPAVSGEIVQIQAGDYRRRRPPKRPS
jgi:DNA replication protein DnaC